MLQLLSGRIHPVPFPDGSFTSITNSSSKPRRRIWSRHEESILFADRIPQEVQHTMILIPKLLLIKKTFLRVTLRLRKFISQGSVSFGNQAFVHSLF